MAAGSAPEYWDGDDDDDAAVVTAASSSSPSRRSSLRDGHHFQELHQYLLSEEAAAGRTTTLPPLEESSDGAPVVVATTHKLSDHSRAIPDLNSSCLCHDHGSLTLPSNFLDWEDDNSQLDIEDEEEIPHTHAELLRPVSIPSFHVFLVSSSSLKIPFPFFTAAYLPWKALHLSHLP